MQFPSPAARRRSRAVSFVSHQRSQLRPALRYATAASACLCVVVLTAVAGGWLTSAGGGRPSAFVATQQPISDSQQRPGGPVRVVRFALYDAGILPREATVEHGRVVVSLTDYTGGGSGLVVERETEDGVRERAGRVERAGGRWRGKQEMSLGPGTYDVYDESRPEARATLTVGP